MIDIAMQKMSTDHPDLNVILVPGDYVGHSISNEPPEWAEEGESPEFKTVQDKLSELKEVTTQVTDLFEKYFKDIPVLSTFGNNDTKYHYQPAFGLNENRFYKFWNDSWFTNHSGNKDLDLTTIGSTVD